MQDAIIIFPSSCEANGLHVCDTDLYMHVYMCVCVDMYVSRQPRTRHIDIYIYMNQGVHMCADM